MTSQLALTIEKAFNPVPYSKEKAYDTLLSAEVALVFADQEAMEELLVADKERGRYCSDLSDQLKAGNREAIEPLLECLSESDGQKIRDSLNELDETEPSDNKALDDLREGHVYMDATLGSLKDPIEIYVNCMVIKLLEQEAGKEAADIYRGHVVFGKKPENIPSQQLEGMKRVYMNDLVTRLYHWGNKSWDVLASKMKGGTTKKLTDHEGKPLDRHRFHHRLHHRISPQGPTDRIGRTLRYLIRYLIRDLKEKN